MVPLLQNRRWIWLFVVVLISFLIDPSPVFGEGSGNETPHQAGVLTQTSHIKAHLTSSSDVNTEAVILIVKNVCPQKNMVTPDEKAEVLEASFKKSRDEQLSVFLNLFLMKSLFIGNN